VPPLANVAKLVRFSSLTLPNALVLSEISGVFSFTVLTKLRHASESASIVTPKPSNNDLNASMLLSPLEKSLKSKIDYIPSVLIKGICCANSNFI